MSHNRTRYPLLTAVAVLLALGCDSGPPPIPKPLVPVPLEKASDTPSKKGVKKKKPVDSELDPDSGHRTRRKLLQEGQPKAD